MTDRQQQYADTLTTLPLDALYRELENLGPETDDLRQIVVAEIESRHG